MNTAKVKPNGVGVPGGDRQRWLPWAAGLVTLLMLAGAILFTRAELRRELRAQLASRDAQVLRALLQRQLAGAMGRADSDPLLAVLDASTLPELPGIVGVRLFDEDGAFFTGLLAATGSESLEPETLALLRAGRAVSHFHDSDAAPRPPALAVSNTMPVLEIALPLNDAAGRTTGLVQFFFDGTSLSAEFGALDANLARQGAIAFGLSAIAIAGALTFAFRRLARSNRQLEEQTRRLIQANQELTLAAKTSAVGAVTSHLLHGLKNPLAGLQQLVAIRTAPDPNGADATHSAAGEDWQDIAATTRRMKSMIDGILQVLRDEEGVAGHTVPVRDVLDMVSRKLSREVTNAGVRWVTRCNADLELSGRDANLVLLIIENLAGNAVQATRRGGNVEVVCGVEQGRLEFRVRDEGPGLPEQVRDRLFTPVRSVKEGGTGLGLALSRQLALHIGASLELVRTGDEGTEFRLTLPVSATRDPAETGFQTR